MIRDAPNMFGIKVPMTFQDRELHQDLGFAVREVQGAKLLAMLAPICPAQKLDPATVVTYQDRLPFGAVVLRGDTLYLRHDVLLATVTQDVLGWLVRVMAHEAMKLRVNLRVPEHKSFAHYTEE